MRALAVLVLACAAAAQEPAPTDAVLRAATRGLPASLVPPESLSERRAWALRGLEGRDDERLREAATRVLAADAQGALPAILSAGAGAYWRTRTAALDAATRGAPLVSDAGARDRLRALAVERAADPVRAVRRQAAALLAEVGEGDEPALRALAADPFFDVRLEAIRAIARLGAPAALDTIAERLRDPDPDLAAAAVDALARAGEGGRSRLAPFLADAASARPLRYRALRILREEASIDGIEGGLNAIFARESEPVDLRAAAAAALCARGARVEPARAIAVLLEACATTEELDRLESAIDGLVALGPQAAGDVTSFLATRELKRFAFNSCLEALPRIAGPDKTRLLRALFDAFGADHEDERAAVGRLLAAQARDGLGSFFASRYESCGSATRRAVLEALKPDDDGAAAIVEKGLADPSGEVRRLAFPLALKTPGLTTARCVDAARVEKEAALRGLFLELLARGRPDAVSRGYLLEELRSKDAELLESVVAGLDVFRGDAEVVDALVEHHDRAQARQIDGPPEEREASWRARRLAIRTIGRVGGPRALAVLRERARCERRIDAVLSIEAMKGVAEIAPDDPLILELVDPPSLREVRVEAAIAAARRGHEKGVLALAKLIHQFDSDTRRRAFDALAAGRCALRREFIESVALDQLSRFSDENRADAIDDLATFADDKAFDALARIARSDRRLESRLEAIRALGKRGGEAAARALSDVAANASASTRNEESAEHLRRAVAKALGETGAGIGGSRLAQHLLEGPFERAASDLLEPDVRRRSMELNRRYDREREAVQSLAQLGDLARAPLQDALNGLVSGGELVLLDPTFLLYASERLLDPLPSASETMTEAALAAASDPESRFRARMNLATLARDRAAAASHLAAAQAMARSGSVDDAFARLFGPPMPRVGRHPRVWLTCAESVARADSAFDASRRDEGKRLLDETLDRGGRDTRVLLDLAASFASHGFPERARELASRARSLAPADRWICESYAWTLLSAGDPRGALDGFREAEAMEADDVALERTTRFGRACALATLGEVDAATALIRALIAEDASYAGALRRSPYLAAVRSAIGR